MNSIHLEMIFHFQLKNELSSLNLTKVLKMQSEEQALFKPEQIATSLCLHVIILNRQQAALLPLQLCFSVRHGWRAGSEAVKYMHNINSFPVGNIPFNQQSQSVPLRASVRGEITYRQSMEG